MIEDYKKGDKVTAKVLDVDVEKERISLGIKQLEGDPMDDRRRRRAQEGRGRHLRGDRREGRRHRREHRRHRPQTFIRRGDLARDRGEQRPERFAVGQKVDARVIQFDRRTRKVQVSIKALEVAEEKEAIAQYGSSDSGATLGDILGTALKRKGEEAAKDDD